MFSRKNKVKTSISGVHWLSENGVYWGYNPLILTIDPNFQRDIQVDLLLSWFGKTSKRGVPDVFLQFLFYVKSV